MEEKSSRKNGVFPNQMQTEHGMLTNQIVLSSRLPVRDQGNIVLYKKMDLISVCVKDTSDYQ